MTWALSIFCCCCTCVDRHPETSALGLPWAPAAGPALHPHQFLVSLHASQQLPKPLLKLRAPGPGAVPIPQLGFSHGDGAEGAASMAHAAGWFTTDLRGWGAVWNLSVERYLT